MKDQSEKPRKDLDRKLDLLEAKIAELRILYEQYFVDVLPQPPISLQKDVARLIKELLKAPFKNSAGRFRLRTLITRYQTYHTYWERVQKQREEGNYFRDVFKADLRDKIQEEEKALASHGGAQEKGFKQLFNSYEKALRSHGGKADNLNYDAFRKSLMQKAKSLKQEHGVSKLHYKIVVKNGKVTVKASSKK